MTLGHERQGAEDGEKGCGGGGGRCREDSDDDEDSAGEASDGEDSDSDAKPAKKKSKGKAGDSPEDDALPAEGERITVQVDGILSDKPSTRSVCPRTPWPASPSWGTRR